MVAVAWTWRMLDAEGREVAVSADFADQVFGSQAEAEGWFSDVFGDLADEGVDAVTLYEGDREVYGPMSLHA